MILRINKTVMYWVAILLLELAFVLIFRGGGILPSPKLAMSQAEADLTRSAITLVLDDIEHGVLDSTESALSALGAELPVSVRAEVLEKIGTPTFEQIAASLREVADTITIK